MNTDTAPIPTYPPLFKNKTKGKVTKWTVSIEPVPQNDQYNIVVTFGETDGKQQTHTTTVEKGKAGRTTIQQSILEANSKWNEKKNRDGYGLQLETPSVEGEMPVMRGVCKISPMLANSFQENLYAPLSSHRGYKIPFPAFVQRKYDGIRCIAQLTPNGNIIMESRKGVEFQHFTGIKTELMRHFQKLLSPHNFYFDGELYCDSLPFEKINGFVRLSKNITEEDRRSMDKIQYHIYDCYDGERPGLPFKERMAILDDIFARVQAEPADSAIERIYGVKTEIVNNVAEMKEKHGKYVEEGFEGIMVRDFNGTYEPNKRSKYLQKYKEFMEEEFEIVGFHDGEGIDKHAVIWDCVTKEGRTFAVKPKSTFEERKRIFKDADSYKGKYLTVVFQEFSPDLIPRFPIGKAIRDVNF
jgi:ATP-dependent DNA ligase